METATTTRSLGPIKLVDGVLPGHVVAKLFATFVGIAMLAGVPMLNGYLLLEHLNIPRGQQGTVTGDLSFWVEIVAIFLFYPFGVLGLIAMSIGYVLMPFATTVGELLVGRLIFAVGMASTAGILATLSNDYPQEQSRGKLIALSSMASILGTSMVSLGILRIPSLFVDRGFDSVFGGKVMFMTVAALGLVAAIVTRFGLAPGTPVARRKRSDTRTLFASGLRSAKNPRIALAYAGAFAARGDLVIKASFLILWAIQDGLLEGLHPGESMARFGLMMTFMSVISFASAPAFGWLIDRINRVSAIIIALVFASGGYLSMYFLTSPLDFSMWPFFMAISLGSSFMMKTSLSLVGQEAKAAERGSVIAMNSMCGAIGILLFTVIGGRLFDSVAPWAPFVLAGAYQVILLVVAVVIRLVAPGRDIHLRADSATA